MVFGSCESLYDIRQYPRGGLIFNVTKIIDHQSCQGDPIFYKSIFKGSKNVGANEKVSFVVMDLVSFESSSGKF
jgi:hypothetical protein